MAGAILVNWDRCCLLVERLRSHVNLVVDHLPITPPTMARRLPSMGPVVVPLSPLYRIKAWELEAGVTRDP